MKTYKRLLGILAGLLILVMGQVSLGQMDPVQPADEEEEAAPRGQEDLEKIFGPQMTQEEMDEYLRKAVKRRLVTERMQVLAHIEDGMLLRYMDEDVDKARTILRDEKADNTQKDNIQRIIRAYAAVEPDLAKPYEMYNKAQALEEEGKEKEATEAFLAAAEKLKESLNTNDSDYYAAAKHYLYAQMLADAGKGWDAIDAYGNVIANMPDRLSFAAGASLASAATFEEMGRGFYAMQMYSFILKEYAATLEQKQLVHAWERYEKLTKMYKDPDPMSAIAKRMDEVHQRLDRLDSGEQTQEKQEEIVAILTDLIKVYEEQKKNDPNQQKQKQKQEKQQQKQGQGQGQEGSAGQQPGGRQAKSGKPQNQGSQPAQSSYLPEGISGRVELKSETRKGLEESGDWAQLPPRTKQKVKEMLQQQLSPKHREAIREYMRGVSGANE